MPATVTEKKALIIFDPAFEAEARAYVEETLQYRELHAYFYMLPVSVKGKEGDELSPDAVKVLFDKHGITLKNTDSYLIIRKETEKKKNPLMRFKEVNVDEDNYNESVLACAKKFKKHSVVVTYYHYLGEKKFDTIRRVRKHNRCTTSQGYGRGAVAQVALWGKKLPDSVSMLKKSFFNENVTCEKPPYVYLTHNNNTAAADVFDETQRNNYITVIENEITFREQSVMPVIVRSVEDYGDPVTVAEKVGNIFHAYAHTDLTVSRSHRELANDIADELHKDENAEWELEDCLKLIKDKVDHSTTPIPPRGEFQGLLLEIINMMYSNSILFVDDDIKEGFDDKYSELATFKESISSRELKNCVNNIMLELKMAEENSKPYSALLRSTEEVLNFLNNPSSVDRHLRFKMLRLERVKQSLPIGDIRSCVDDIEQELKKLRQEGRPSLILLRSIDAAINFIDSPSVANRERQLSIAKEVGFHSWGRLLKGLLFCLAGVSFGVGIGLAAYFTGGTALLVSGPLMIKGIMLSAALVETGVAIAAGAAVASAPLITAGVCFFGKQPIRTKMEALVDCVDSDQRAVRISQV